MKVIFTLFVVLCLSGCAAQQALTVRQAPGSHAQDYKSFSIQVINKARGLNLPAMVKVGKAIKYALEQKGLMYVEQNGELLVEYGVGLRNTNEVNLHFYPAGMTMRTQHDVEEATIAKMVININDVKQKRSIWLVSGSAKVDDEEKSQDEINKVFVGIFSQFE